MRMGAKKRPFYRVVVADQRSPRDGRFIENIGKYHPLEDPSLIEIDEQRALHWLRVGAQPSESVVNLLNVAGIWEKFVAERPGAAGLAKPARAGKPAAAKKSKKAKAAAGATEAGAGAPSPASQGAPEAPAQAAAEDATAGGSQGDSAPAPEEAPAET